jgi:hypothetical protein
MANLNNGREVMKNARMAGISWRGGILANHHVIHHLCGLEAVTTLEGTESMRTLIIEKDLTGISAFA